MSFTCEICILAGGLSQRMGRDKACLRLGSRTMLGHIKETATRTGYPVRIIKRDILPGCGPAGGVHTALSTTTSDAVLFLACDMPFIELELLRFIFERLGDRPDSIFVKTGPRVGFPFLLSRKTLPLIAKQLCKRAFSLQNLAHALNARTIRLPLKFRAQLSNVNTPEQWEIAKKLWRTKKPAAS